MVKVTMIGFRSLGLGFKMVKGTMTGFRGLGLGFTVLQSGLGV